MITLLICSASFLIVTLIVLLVLRLKNLLRKKWRNDNNMRYCKTCLMPETRPRIKFNSEGVCNGCEWNLEKKHVVNWESRWNELKQLCDKYRIRDGSNWDVIVPCSFGKDSYHIAWNLKNRLGMHPLLVNIPPLIPSKIGMDNKLNLLGHGFDAVQVDINPKIRWMLTKIAFVEEGAPQTPFAAAISSAPLILGIKLGIPLVMYGEEGESEYGGDIGLREKPVFNREWAVDKYLRGVDPEDVYVRDGISREDIKWWVFPSQREIDDAGLFVTHWSYFENWDHHLHKNTALSIGFQTFDKNVSGDIGVTDLATFTDYTSLDDPFLRTFHTYLMFLKFGWGRGSQEATNDIRVDGMTREEGIRMAERFDDYNCQDYKQLLLSGMDMSEQEFDTVIDKWANTSVVCWDGGKWKLKHPIK